MASRVTVRARVRVVLDVDVSDTWGGDCLVLDRPVSDQERSSIVAYLREKYDGA